MALSHRANRKIGRISSRKLARCGTLPGRVNVNRSRMQIFYSGNVQGVGFRYTVKTVATGFELSGTVRNLPDGRVELVAEGIKDELKAFQQAIRESGLEHFIRDEQVAWSEPQNQFRGFEIVR
jgi:acylphosphatase